MTHFLHIRTLIIALASATTSAAQVQPQMHPLVQPHIHPLVPLAHHHAHLQVQLNCYLK